MDTAPENVKKEFQRQFERLVVLDYIIRNTGTFLHSVRKRKGAIHILRL